MLRILRRAFVLLMLPVVLRTSAPADEKDGSPGPKAPELWATPASSEAEVDMRSLRSAFRENLLNAVLPEKKAYAAQLRELEKRLAAAKDYQGAIKTRDERRAIEMEVTAFEQEMPALAVRAAGQGKLLPERIVFRPLDAVLSGMKLDKDGAITGWDVQKCSASWKLPGLPAGGYEVIIKCAGSGEPTGLEVREKFYLLRGKVSGSENKKLENSLGTLRISDGSGSLTLVSDGTGRPAELRLTALELAPVNR